MDDDFQFCSSPMCVCVCVRTPSIEIFFILLLNEKEKKYIQTWWKQNRLFYFAFHCFGWLITFFSYIYGYYYLLSSSSLYFFFLFECWKTDCIIVWWKWWCKGIIMMMLMMKVKSQSQWELFCCFRLLCLFVCVYENKMNACEWIFLFFFLVFIWNEIFFLFRIA